MILDKTLQRLLKNSLDQGVTINVQNKTEDAPQKETFGVDYTEKDGFAFGVKQPEMPTVRLDEIEIDRYKVPFFFVTGVLIGVAFGLRRGKVVVLR